MDDRSEPILRLKGCLRCDGLFGLCRSCDRGQRYCGEACRRQARLEQHRRRQSELQALVDSIEYKLLKDRVPLPQKAAGLLKSHACNDNPEI